MKLGLIRLSQSSYVAFNIVNEKVMDLMAALIRMYEKLSASNKVFLIKMLSNMMMIDENPVVEHQYKFNTMKINCARLASNLMMS